MPSLEAVPARLWGLKMSPRQTSLRLCSCGLLVCGRGGGRSTAWHFWEVFPAGWVHPCSLPRCLLGRPSVWPGSLSVRGVSAQQRRASCCWVHSTREWARGSWTCHLDLSLVLISVRRCSSPRVANDLHPVGSKKAVSALVGFYSLILFSDFHKQPITFFFV